ncbi:MAG: hypothetical protein AB7O62_05980 [Pirellulales bacterium]
MNPVTGPVTGACSKAVRPTGSTAISVDADLARIVQAWDKLPVAMRAGIVAMVEAAAQQ